MSLASTAVVVTDIFAKPASEDVIVKMAEETMQTEAAPAPAPAAAPEQIGEFEIIEFRHLQSVR